MLVGPEIPEVSNDTVATIMDRLITWLILEFNAAPTELEWKCCRANVLLVRPEFDAANSELVVVPGEENMEWTSQMCRPLESLGASIIAGATMREIM